VSYLVINSFLQTQSSFESWSQRSHNLFENEDDIFVSKSYDKKDEEDMKNALRDVEELVKQPANPLKEEQSSMQGDHAFPSFLKQPSNADVLRNQLKASKPVFKRVFPEYSDKIIVMLFYEDDCWDCMAVRQLFQEFVTMYQDVVFLETKAKTNIDALKSLRITYLPTFVAFRNHLEIGRMVTADAKLLEVFIQGISKNT